LKLWIETFLHNEIKYDCRCACYFDEFL